MLGLTSQVFLIYLCICTLGHVLAWGASGTSARGRTGNPQKFPYNGLAIANQPSSAARQSPPEKKISRGLGISAWGLVGLMLTFIIGGIVIYYIILFYPIMCKKERKYDMMELSQV